MRLARHSEPELLRRSGARLFGSASARQDFPSALRGLDPPGALPFVGNYRSEDRFLIRLFANQQPNPLKSCFGSLLLARKLSPFGKPCVAKWKPFELQSSHLIENSLSSSSPRQPLAQAGNACSTVSVEVAELPRQRRVFSHKAEPSRP